MDIIFRELTRALTIAQATFGISILHKVAVQQAVKVKPAGDVVVARLTGAIGVPAVAKPERFNGIQMLINHHHVVMPPDALKPHLHQHREEMPVVIGDLNVGALA